MYDRYEYLTNKGCSVVHHGVPCFKLRYKFNPPDDENELDLFHEIITHEDPSELLKPGDPLPILYRIYKERGVEFVDSMPFPLPLNGFVSVKDVFYNYYNCGITMVTM